jgi:hypothetical protein
MVSKPKIRNQKSQIRKGKVSELLSIKDLYLLKILPCLT